MTQEHIRLSPHCFVAGFGDPVGPPAKDKVEDGRYVTHPYHWTDNTGKGDILLLYCAGPYAGHRREAPGVGVVAGVNRETDSLCHRYLPLERPLSMDTIRARLTQPDRKRSESRRFSTFWIFGLMDTSFQSLMKDCKVRWPS